MTDPTPEARRAELHDRLAVVRERVARAADAAGRPADELTLVVVTKFFPATDLATLLELGVHDVGESRDQEAAAKLAQLAPGERPTVHFIGQLQTNKAAHVARYADVVHSVDRERLVRALDRALAVKDAPHDAPTDAPQDLAQPDRRLAVLLQVDLDDPDQRAQPDQHDQPAQPDKRRAARGGCRPDDLPALADAVARAERLDLRGLMAVAPRGGDPAAAFARLRELSQRLQVDHPEATWLSAGMSGDLEQAVAAGATHLRVGSAILGPRPPAG